MNIRPLIRALLVFGGYLIIYSIGCVRDQHSIFPYGIISFVWIIVFSVSNHYTQGMEKDPQWEAYKKMREEQQQDVRRREALDEKLCSKKYTQAEMEYLIYTADLSTEQKNILRKKHLDKYKSL